jgi:hypothetical protein
MSSVNLNTRPVKAAPTPNISAQVPTNVSRMPCGFEPRAISALTPKAGVRVKINANVTFLLC